MYVANVLHTLVICHVYAYGFKMLHWDIDF